MTTPAHCTRTWRTVGYCSGNDGGAHHCSALDSYHHLQHVCVCGNVEPPAHCTRTTPHTGHLVADDSAHGLVSCPGVPYGVEPPADVQATPDPRLDHDPRRMVLAKVLQDQIPALTGMGAAEIAQYGLYALDDFAAAQAMDGPDEPKLTDWQREVLGAFRPREIDPAPAELSAAQEIRLRVLEQLLGDNGRYVDGDGNERAKFAEQMNATMLLLAAAVEHGPDETPHDDRVRELERQLTRAVASSEALQQRADLAEARLGQVDDLCRDTRYDHAQMFLEGIRDALAWTPDDTAPAGAATGDGS